MSHKSIVDLGREFFRANFDFYTREAAIAEFDLDPSMTDRDIWDEMCLATATEDEELRLCMLICPEMHTFMQEQIDFARGRDNTMIQKGSGNRELEEEL